MKFDAFQWRSLKTRVTILTLAIFMVGIWSLVFYGREMLRETVQRLLGEQQLSTASFIAAGVNDELEVRLKVLDKTAAAITPAIFESAAHLQAFFEQRPLLAEKFSGGVFAVSVDGTAIADFPVVQGRRGTNHRDNPSIRSTLADGRPAISKPTIGRVLKKPVFGITVPIRDGQGNIMGALVGLINLGLPSFLDKITENRFGKSGGYLLVAPQHRLIVTATDKSRIMEVLPAAGINPTIDRFIDGYEGSAILTNPHGIQVLASARRVPVAGWYVAAVLPIDEAYGAFATMRQRVLLAALFLSVLTGALTWWLVRSQLAPLVAAARTLSMAPEKDKYPSPLPIVRQDEIGDLIGGFNRLLEMLAQREAALRESEVRFRDLTEMSSDFYWETDAAHRLTTRTESKREAGDAVMHQTTSLGRRRWEIPYLAPDEAGWQRHRATLDAHLPFRNFEISRNRASGSVHHLTVSGDPVFDAAGNFTGYRGVGTDVTDEKHAEARRLSLEAQLRESQKMEAIGTLAGGIAHDFNNILATILGNTELARQDLHNNPQALESLGEIQKASARARDLVQQILSFSRRQPTERKQTALPPVVEESARLLRATLPARLHLQVSIAPDIPPVLADATQFQQVILNLATNAFQSIQAGPGHIGIRLDTALLDAATLDAHPALRALCESRGSRMVRLTVSDDGPGMDAATQARIFEPFFTTKTIDKGTGLGLSVVHGIVLAHGGEITVVSEPGKGAIFTVYLPAAADAGAPASAPHAHDNLDTPALSAATKSTPAAKADGRRILYLDDDDSVVFLVTRLLERRGLQISGFTDQAAALTALRADPGAFDLVVTDYNMPGMSGLDVAREARTIRADLPVAIASGFVDESLRDQAAGAGVRELIFKASNVDEFCEAFVRLAKDVGVKSTDS